MLIRKENICINEKNNQGKKIHIKQIKTRFTKLMKEMQFLDSMAMSMHSV